jgi:hypothetical protein
MAKCSRYTAQIEGSVTRKQSYECALVTLFGRKVAHDTETGRKIRKTRRGGIFIKGNRSSGDDRLLLTDYEDKAQMK